MSGARLLRRLRSDPLGLLGLALVLLVVFCGVFAHWIAPYRPNKIKVPDRFTPPGRVHIIGTDNLGRDVFSRVINGSQIALIVGVTSIAIALAIGLMLGLIAGYGPRWLDNIAAADLRFHLLVPDGHLRPDRHDPARPEPADADVRRRRHPDPGLCAAGPDRDARDEELRIHPGRTLARRQPGPHPGPCTSCPTSSVRCSSSAAWTSPR